MTELKIFGVIDGGASRTEAQWTQFVQIMKAENAAVMTQWVLGKATGKNKPHLNIHFDLVSIDTRYRVFDFVLDRDDKDPGIAVMDAELVNRSLATTGNNKVKFARLLLAEFREALTLAGIGAGVVNSIDVEIIAAGTIYAAGTDAIAWLYDGSRKANWIPDPIG